MKPESKAIRTIYHGSDHIIERPSFGGGKPYNDYGQGFYCTENLDMAKEWGVSKDRNGFANCYSINCESLSILDLNCAEYCILHWLSILLDNREFEITSPLAFQAKAYILDVFHIDYSHADCIIGYQADDSYFSFAMDFLNGTISYRQLNHAMHLGKLGQQFVIKSRKAFDRLVSTGYEVVTSKDWYTRKMNRDRAARRQYFDLEKNLFLPHDLFITEILKEEMKPDDSRLR